MSQRDPVTDERAQQALVDELRSKRRTYLWGQRGWTVAYHGTLYSTPIVGAITTILAGTAAGKGITATAAAVTTALGTMAGLGRFEAKWRVNRLDRSELDILILEAEGENHDLTRIRKTFEGIIRRHDLDVVARIEPSKSK